jgi:hydrogenase expression/formation protein HypC
MCIGIPMQVVSCADGIAVAEGRGRRERLNLMLTGDQPPGAWVLAYQGSAVRVMSADEARQTAAALDALDAALDGSRELGAFFADLVDREPELPAHLKERR